MDEALAVLIGAGVAVVSGFATQILSRFWYKKDKEQLNTELMAKHLNELYIKGKSITEPDYGLQITRFDYTKYNDYLSSLTPILHMLPARIEAYINELDRIYKDWENFDEETDMQDEMSNIFIKLENQINILRYKILDIKGYTLGVNELE